MNRISKEYGASTTTGSYQHQQHRRGRSLSNGSSTVINSRDTDENLDLFSRNRRTLSLTSDESDGGMMKLGKVAVKLGRNGMDDLLASVDGGKNDYDWLLTPPGTPLLSDTSESQQTLAPSRNIASLRSVSSSKTSRLSVTQTENSYPSRPTRSSSVTRSYSSNPNRSSSILNTSSGSVTSISRPSSSILNTSSASVTSLSRPATPSSRSTFTSSSNRPSTPTSRVLRPSTPIKSRPTTNNSLGEKPRAPQNHPRPSTPTSRPQTPTTSNSSISRTSSRPSTPTRRIPTQNQQLNGNPPSTGRVIGNGRNSAPVSRGNSPSPRPRPATQPIVPPDFPLDTPPNLRTTMPDRPVSAGRSRPSTPSSIRGNSEPGPIVPPRRQSSSPIVARGRLPDLGKVRPHSNGHNITANENQKTPPSMDSAMRRAVKSAAPTESTGFGRTISKKSLDMALRHMDIRNGSGGVRSSPGSTLFPQSIRPGTTKGHSARVSDIPGPQENGNYNDRPRDNEYKVDVGRYIGRMGEPDIYESSRYDSILLKEDIKNTNWLMNVDDKSDQGSIFDHRFESLPEPFDPL
ncbi:hypothetical protein ACHQM5_021963 [Ranunculus cassubicifolius]